MDWRTEYAGWGALRKLEWMDAVIGEIAQLAPPAPELTADDLPVDAMHWTLADHYAGDERLPIGDARQFDSDLRRLFASAADSPAGELAANFLARHEGELVARVAYWSGVGPAAVRSLLRALMERAAALALHVAGLEAATLIELAAFGTAVVMHWRYTNAFRATRAEVRS
jgi:hypothetical protein